MPITPSHTVATKRAIAKMSWKPWNARPATSERVAFAAPAAAPIPGDPS